MLLFELFLLALAAAVHASLEDRGARHLYPAQCADVKSLVAASHCPLPATKFCASYLRISKATTTVTTTSTLTSAITINLPGIPTTTTVTTTDTSTSTSTVTPLCSVPPPGGTKLKRGAGAYAVREPCCLSTFAQGSALSSACSCLSIPQSTITSTSTVVTTTSSLITITLSAPTSTITDSTSTIVTSTSTAPVATPTELYIYNAAVPNYGALNGGLGQLFLSYYFDVTARVSFTLNALGNLLVGSVNDNGYQGALGDVNKGADPSYVMFDFLGDIATSDRAPITCNIQTSGSSTTCVLACTNPEGGSDDGYIGLALRATLGDGQLSDGGSTGSPYTPYVVDINA